MTFDDLCPNVLSNNFISPFIAFQGVKADQKSPIDITQKVITRFNRTKQGGAMWNFGISQIRLHPLKLSPTVIKSGTAAYSMFHYEEARPLLIQELKRLCFFPDKYQFNGKYQEIKDRLGNCVPPGVIRAVAMNVGHYVFEGGLLAPFQKGMSYLDILEATWQDHLREKDEDAPTVISTFAGCGGSSLGYSMAGYRELLAVEMDNNAVETFKLNFQDVPVFHGDIAALSVEQCMTLAGLTEPGQLDVLDGSPPCQGFSTAGKRQMKDCRNQLFHEYVRLLRGLQPKAFIMENVSGMVKGKMKLIFADIMRELKASGYEVKCWLLNAKYFYVPQSRERLFFIGVRSDFWKSLHV